MIGQHSGGILETILGFVGVPAVALSFGVENFLFIVSQAWSDKENSYKENQPSLFLFFIVSSLIKITNVLNRSMWG